MSMQNILEDDFQQYLFGCGPEFDAILKSIISQNPMIFSDEESNQAYKDIVEEV